MQAAIHERPTTLEQGAIYLRKERGAGSGRPVFIPVRFASYDPCPAMVIVQEENCRVRCAREDLFASAADQGRVSCTWESIQSTSSSAGMGSSAS